MTFTASSPKTPCPICNRTSSGCRQGEGGILCRLGNTFDPFKTHTSLKKIGDVVSGTDGVVYALKGLDNDTSCPYALFGEHKERAPREVTKTRHWRYQYADGRAGTVTHTRDDFNYGPKDYRWTPGTKPDLLLPLWYDELPAAGSGELIFLTEGETGAEALRGLGLVATSVPNGCTSWKSGLPDLAKFVGNSLVLCPDRDHAGVVCMQRIADACPEARWLLAEPHNTDDWSDPTDAYDVADWVADGATAEMVLAAIRGTAPVLPTKPWWERVPYVGEEGKLSKMTANGLSKLLQGHLGSALRWNLLKSQPELDGCLMSELDASEVYINAEKAGISIEKGPAADSFVHAARCNGFHPVVDYLDSCKTPLTSEEWENPLDTLLGDGWMRTDDMDKHDIDANHAFYNRAFRKWAINAVARVYSPGCYGRMMFILAGIQEGGKTEFFRHLVGEDFFLEGFSISSKDADDKMKLGQYWIIEFGEVDDAYNKAGIEEIKRFISSTKDVYRAPYFRRPESHKRTFMLCGTTNKREGFLADTTGNTRFVIVPLAKQIDLGRVAGLRDRFWGAAAEAYRSGEWWDLPDEDKEQRNKLNLAWTVGDTWEHQLGEYLNRPAIQQQVEGWKTRGSDGVGFSGADLMQDVLRIPTERQDQRSLTRVSKAMLRLGWGKGQTRPDRKLRYIPNRLMS